MHIYAPIDAIVKIDDKVRWSKTDVAGQSMKQQPARWVRVKPLEAQEKLRIGAVCDAFIGDVLTPRFLPEITHSQWNYPFALSGKWRGSKYSFITRYRSGFEDNAGEEFDCAWVRFDHDEESLDEVRFHIMWHRHTEQWFPLHHSVSLDEALRLMLANEVLHPHI